VTKRQLMLISGGTGITPFFKIIREVVLRPQLSARCLASYHTPGDALLIDDLEQASRCGRFEIIHHFTSSQGRLSQQHIATAIADWKKADTFFFVCGRPEFNSAMCQSLVALGFDMGCCFVFA
jgi:ferredoxin-NADP reductase